MANSTGKKIDTTCLSIVGHTASRGYIHRDYLAHCLRYSHVARYMNEGRKHQTAHVLDVGCGREAPLARLLYSMKMTHTTGSYTGVDYGNVKWPDTIPQGKNKFNGQFIGKVDFAEDAVGRKKFDVIVSLEVLEHVEAYHAWRMMRRMRSLMKRDSRCFLSTPCYDQKTGAAGNHVNEMSHRGFKALIHAAGLEVESVWGTFASQKDYKKLMTPGQQEVFEALRPYYDSSTLSCFMAPMFPEQARNCIWRLKPGTVLTLAPSDLKELADPSHGSSKDWGKDLKKIMKEASK